LFFSEWERGAENSSPWVDIAPPLAASQPVIRRPKAKSKLLFQGEDWNKNV